MKIAICADLHFRGKKLEDKRKAWEQAGQKMIDEKIDMVILAGDTFDNRQIGSRESSTGSVAEAFLTPSKKLIQAGIKVFAVKGNGVHEGTNGEQKSPLEIFKGTGIEVADQNMMIEKESEMVTISLLPWLEDEDRTQKLAEALEKIKNRNAKYKLIVGHITVRGCTLNNGMQLQGTGEFEVDARDLEATGADLIVLGHIHKRQQIGQRIWYVGALTQDSFGDEGNPQGFMIVDTEKRTHEFVEIDAPEYRTIEMKSNAEMPVPRDSGDYIKLRFKEKPTAEMMEDIKNNILNYNMIVEIVPEREIITRKVEGVEAGRSDEELLRAWLAKDGKYGIDDVDRIITEARAIAEGLK
jgi:DNA repair exonuclease SbcCD nuclease subunit